MRLLKNTSILCYYLQDLISTFMWKPEVQAVSLRDRNMKQLRGGGTKIPQQSETN
jgi:hypothetical protein